MRLHAVQGLGAAQFHEGQQAAPPSATATGRETEQHQHHQLRYGPGRHGGHDGDWAAGTVYASTNPREILTFEYKDSFL